MFFNPSQYSLEKKQLLQEVDRLTIELIKAHQDGQTNLSLLLNKQLETVLKQYVAVKQAKTDMKNQSLM